MRRQALVPIAALLFVVTLGIPAVADDLCDLDQVVIFASNSVQIGREAVVAGDLIANNASAGPVLDEGELAVDQRATVNGSCAGDTVDLDKFSTVSGSVRYNELSAGKATIGGSQSTPLILPVYSELPIFGPAAPSGVDVVVGAGQTVVVGDVGPGDPLARQDFGDVTIGDGGTLVFSGGGRFDVASITGGPGARVEFSQPGELRVAGKLFLDRDSFLGSSALSGSEVVVYAGGANGATGGLFQTPAAVDIGRDSEVYANLYAPNGTILFGQGSDATGSFLGRDVDVRKNSSITLDSAFSNLVPTGVDQEVQTVGTDPLTITLTGGDPEGKAISFSIQVPPTAGTLGPITPIVPAPVSQCSQSGAACTFDTDCPFFAGGETCEVVQPPVTQATVTYTPLAAGVEDFFTFGVTDPCGALGTAVVSINGGSDEADVPVGVCSETIAQECTQNSDCPASETCLFDGVDSVSAADLELDATVNQVKTITLSAAAPDTVATLTFRVETLPTGALQDSNGAAVVAGGDLPSPILTYQAPAAAGADSFTFSARDSATTTPPCGPPSCDTAAVNISVGNLPELAPDQSAGTDLNTPVEVTLRANAGGTGDGGGGGALSAYAGSYEVTHGDNGKLTAAQITRARSRQGTSPRGPGTRAGSAGPTALNVDGGWFQFSWCDTGTSPGCNDLVDLVNEVEVNESPFDFTTAEPSCLRITDTLAKGDHWRVEASGGDDWTDFTSEVDQSTTGTTGDPDTAFGDLTYSHGAFDLVGSGAYSVKLTTIPPDSFAFGTAGYVRVDTGPCVDIVWQLTSLPDNGTLTYNGAPVTVGQTWVSEPTLVYTPTFNYSGPDSFGYNVTQNGTVGVAVVDSAIVDLIISSNDPCVLVGREPGCSTGFFFAEGAAASSAATSSEVDPGPREGLTVVVEGQGGSVSSAPVEWPGRRAPSRLHCGGGECNEHFPAGATVTLFARPDGEHFEFLGWSGDCSGSEPKLTITVDRATRCTARFGPRR